MTSIVLHPVCAATCETSLGPTYSRSAPPQPRPRDRAEKPRDCSQATPPNEPLTGGGPEAAALVAHTMPLAGRPILDHHASLHHPGHILEPPYVLQRVSQEIQYRPQVA